MSGDAEVRILALERKLRVADWRMGQVEKRSAGAVAQGLNQSWVLGNVQQNDPYAEVVYPPAAPGVSVQVTGCSYLPATSCNITLVNTDTGQNYGTLPTDRNGIVLFQMAIPVPIRVQATAVVTGFATGRLQSKTLFLGTIAAGNIANTDPDGFQDGQINLVDNLGNGVVAGFGIVPSCWYPMQSLTLNDSVWGGPVTMARKNGAAVFAGCRNINYPGSQALACQPVSTALNYIVTGSPEGGNALTVWDKITSLWPIAPNQNFCPLPGTCANPPQGASNWSEILVVSTAAVDRTGSYSATLVTAPNAGIIYPNGATITLSGN